MSSFATLAAGSCPRHEELALGLGAELGCAEDDARERLLGLAADLEPAADPLSELRSVRELVERLAPVADGPLLLPAALDVDPSAPEELVDGRFLGHDLSWRCAHETALCLLNHMSTGPRNPATSPPRSPPPRCGSPSRSRAPGAPGSPSSTRACSPA